MMKTTKWTQKKLIDLFHQINPHGQQMTRKQWIKHTDTPSDMPVRCLFGNWNNFIIACGGIPYKPYLSEIAKENSRKAHLGQRGFAWKGGKIKDKNGYSHIWSPHHPNCKSAGYVLEHRLVMSKFLGRPLKDDENVHHKNGNRSDNQIENLELWTTSQPSGQRVEDKINWSIQFLQEYGFIIIPPKTSKKQNTEANNIKICEGDIVKYTYKMDDHGDLQTDEAQVFYDDSSACYVLKSSNSDYQEYMHEVMMLPGFSVEVTGNIFESVDKQK